MSPWHSLWTWQHTIAYPTRNTTVTGACRRRKESQYPTPFSGLCLKVSFSVSSNHHLLTEHDVWIKSLAATVPQTHLRNEAITSFLRPSNMHDPRNESSPITYYQRLRQFRPFSQFSPTVSGFVDKVSYTGGGVRVSRNGVRFRYCSV